MVRGGEVVTRLAHNQEIDGSNPSRATNHYIYTDHRKGERVRWAYGARPGLNMGKPYPVLAGEVIFACDAADIVEADAKLLAATGIEAGAFDQREILCRVESL